MDDILKGLAGIAAQALPSFGTVIGAALGGPAGAAVGAALGRSVAPMIGIEPDDTDALGKAISERPDEVGAAIEKVAGTPDKFAALVALVGEETRQMQIINETARIELASEDRFVRWARPANLWANAIAALLMSVGVFIAMLGAIAGRPDALNQIANASGAMLAIFGALGGVAGVSAWMRGKEKMAGVAGSTPPITAVIGGVASVIKGAKR